ncbi:PilX N-terminal domain-containing pilus assembly protein [Psychrobacter sp. ANT_WB68]|uniref:PilX N-terminal domain-containing pilus assembly protein n=1 Tax=Psychrobacter sp. ANT_WB68 TaxID=2597355 RepID=UPI0011F315DE|nr:PilX N-terminal domain-containing pilus assembly protein [Psychrobacter sp. ANT_WB68]KAA0913662.1 pilus assembly protein PilX [Psychrobacter sp. ANT_WB68]
MIRYRDLSSSTQKHINMGLAFRSTEQGATLIVVLLFLVLIMLAGAIAVRQSTTDLKIATSDQINTVLLQSADSANQKLETMVNGSPASEGYKDVTSVTGALGHFLLFEDNKVNEFIYCFNPRTQRYLTNSATVRVPAGGYVDGLNNGVCNYANASDYTSARQAVMTQVSIALTPPSVNATPFEHVVIGKEVEDRTSKKFQFDIRPTSSLPAYSEPKVGGDKCFEQTSIRNNVATGKKSLNECLLAASTPSKMLYEQADVENVSSSTKCYPFGRGSMNSKCVLSTP